MDRPGVLPNTLRSTAKFFLLPLRCAVWLAVAVAATTLHAKAQDLPDRLNNADETRPVTAKGPFAGFISTPQIFNFAPVSAFVIAPNQRWFAAYTGYSHAGIRIMDMQTGVLLRVLNTNGRWLSGLSISPDSRVVSAIDDKDKPFAWDAATGERVDHAFGAIARIDHLSDYTTSNDLKANSLGPAITQFLKNYGLSDQFPGPDSIDEVIRSVDGRYALILNAKLDLSTDENGTFYRLVKVWDLQHKSPALTVRVPNNRCGGYPEPSSFAYDGRYFILGTHGGGCEPDYTDSAVFEVKDGTARPLWQTECSVYPDQKISRDTRFYTVSEGLNGHVTEWDLGKAQRVAHFDEGWSWPIISADGGTFAVIKTDDRGVLFLRHGKRQRLHVHVDEDETTPPVYDHTPLSPNGRYFAATIAATSPGERRSVVVWDTNTGRQVGRLESPDDGDWKIAGVSNAGRVLLLRDKSVFKSGQWLRVAKAENSLIVPLTPNFRPVCGVIFCDRIMPDRGVVERVLPNDAKIDDEQINVASFVGSITAQSPDGRFILVNHAVVDVVTGRTLLHTHAFEAFEPAFTSDSRSVLDGLTLRDVVTGKRIWSLQGTPDFGFVMMFPDGHVRVSPGAEKYVKLVRGFEVKPFDEAARRQFEPPENRIQRSVESGLAAQ